MCWMLEVVFKYVYMFVDMEVLFKVMVLHVEFRL